MYLDKETTFVYLWIIIIFIWFFTTAYIPTIGFIVGLVLASIYLYYKTQETKNEVDDLNLELNYKLNSLLFEEGKKPPDMFYTEPDLITFFYNIKEYRVYNRDSYFKAIKTANNLLKLRKDLENDFIYTEEGDIQNWQTFGHKTKSITTTNIKNYDSIMKISEEFATKSVNFLHTFSICLPPNFKNKFLKTLDRYHLLMKRITDDIYFHCKKMSKNPLVTSNYGKPKGYKTPNNFEFFV